MEVYATTDNEAQAAAIAQRLIDEGRDATTADVADLPDVRSQYRYAVLAEPITGNSEGRANPTTPTTKENH
jgi:hypothetical protein